MHIGGLRLESRKPEETGNLRQKQTQNASRIWHLGLIWEDALIRELALWETRIKFLVSNVSGQVCTMKQVLQDSCSQVRNYLSSG